MLHMTKQVILKIRDICRLGAIFKKIPLIQVDIALAPRHLVESGQAVSNNQQQCVNYQRGDCLVKNG